MLVIGAIDFTNMPTCVCVCRYSWDEESRYETIGKVGAAIVGNNYHKFWLVLYYSRQEVILNTAIHADFYYVVCTR